MRLLSPRFPLGFRLALPGALLAAMCLLGACDKHSAADIPESYGHGSSHQPNYSDHQVDSHNDSKSFSDTQGTRVAGKTGEGAERKTRPAESPSASQPGRFFPN